MHPLWISILFSHTVCLCGGVEREFILNTLTGPSQMILKSMSLRPRDTTKTKNLQQGSKVHEPQMLKFRLQKGAFKPVNDICEVVGICANNELVLCGLCYQGVYHHFSNCQSCGALPKTELVTVEEIITEVFMFTAPDIL